MRIGESGAYVRSSFREGRWYDEKNHSRYSKRTVCKNDPAYAAAGAGRIPHHYFRIPQQDRGAVQDVPALRPPHGGDGIYALDAGGTAGHPGSGCQEQPGLQGSHAGG